MAGAPSERGGKQEQRTPPRKSRTHGEPLHQCHIADVLDVNVERRRTHSVADCDMEIPVIPPDDPRAVFPAKLDLQLTGHCRSATTDAGRVPSMTRATAGSLRACSGLPTKMISPRSIT